MSLLSVILSLNLEFFEKIRHVIVIYFVYCLMKTNKFVLNYSLSVVTDKQFWKLGLYSWNGQLIFDLTASAHVFDGKRNLIVEHDVF